MASPGCVLCVVARVGIDDVRFCCLCRKPEACRVTGALSSAAADVYKGPVLPWFHFQVGKKPQHLGFFFLTYQLKIKSLVYICLLYTFPSPRDAHEFRMPFSA